jgi:hypothetical protein
MARQMLGNRRMITGQQEQTDRHGERTLERTTPWTPDDGGNGANPRVAVVPPPREPRCVDGELVEA